jgi:hypothetical protein
MRHVRLILVAGLLSAFLLAACGEDSSNELRSGEAGTLRSTLTEVEQRVESQDCAGAGEQVAAFRSEVDELPQRVDADLRQALRSSADRLESLVANECTAEPAPTETPDLGTTSPDTGQGNEEDQQGQQDKDKKPKKEKPNQDQTQTETQPPDTGGTGEEVPGVGNQGDGGTSPEG